MRFFFSIIAAFMIAPAAYAADADGAMPVGRVTKIDSSLLTSAPLKGDYMLGKPGATVTLIEYASLSCPHCAHFSGDVLPSLQKDFIDTGKLRYIMRPYPLNEPALKGAMLVDCLGEQDPAKYYTFVSVLFGAQDKWAFDANFLSSLETFASVGGVSKEQFQKCTVDSDRETKLLKIKESALKELKVNGTPAIFIGNERYEGALTVEAVSLAIKQKLK